MRTAIGGENDETHSNRASEWMQTLPESPLSKYILRSHNKQVDWSSHTRSKANKSINTEMMSDIQQNLMNRFIQKSIRPEEIQTERTLHLPNLSDDYYLNVVDYDRRGDALVAGLNNDLWCSRGIFSLEKAPRSRHMLRFPDAEQITSVSCGPPTHLAVGTSKCRILVTSLKSDGGLVRQDIPILHCFRVSSLHWRDHNVFTSGGKDRQIITYDIRQSTPISQIANAHEQEVCGLRWNKDLLASGGNDNALIVWDARKMGSPLWEIRQHTAAVKALAWSPTQDGVLATGGGSADKRIIIWNVKETVMDEEEGIMMPRKIACKETGSQVCALTWSPNRPSNEIWSAHGFSEHECIRWSVPQMERRAIMRGHTKRVLYLAGPNEEGMMASISSDLSVRIWNGFEMSPKRSLTRHCDNILDEIEFC